MVPYDQPEASLAMINRWVSSFSVGGDEKKKEESNTREDL